MTLTAKNKGLCGNDIGLGYKITSGIGTTVTVVAMSAGATNPTLQTALTTVYSTRYHLIVTPFNNQHGPGHAQDPRRRSIERGGTARAMGFYATTGTAAAATTLAGQVNSSRIAGAFVRYTAGTTQKQTPSWKLAAMTAAGIAADPDVSNPIRYLSLIPGRCAHGQRPALAH